MKEYLILSLFLIFTQASSHSQSTLDPTDVSPDKILSTLTDVFPFVQNLHRSWKKLSEMNLPTAYSVDDLVMELRRFNQNAAFYDGFSGSSNDLAMSELNDKVRRLTEQNRKSNDNILKLLNSLTSFIIWSHANKCNLTSQEMQDYHVIASSILDQYESSLINVAFVDEHDCLLKVDNQCFTYHVNKLSWSNARQFCKLRGGDLASGQQYNKLVAITKSERATGKAFSTYMWMGASDHEAENVWKWVDGVTLDTSDSRWGEDDPDYGDNDHCLGVGTRKIYDRNCEDLNSFICEVTL